MEFNKLKKYMDHVNYFFMGLLLCSTVFMIGSFTFLLVVAPFFYLGSYYFPFLAATATSLYYWGRKAMKEIQSWK